MPTKIAIVEDNAGICEQLRNILSRDPELSCVCVCRNATSALKSIPEAAPDIIIMDIQLPDGSGIDCTSQLTRLIPDTKVLMFTISDETEQIIRALEAGASGYLLKDTPPAGILAALHEVRLQGAPMSREVARKLIETYHRPRPRPAWAESLTPRETEIIYLLADGLLYKEIADRLDIRIDTVNAHIKNIYRKLDVRSRTQAVIKFQNTNESRTE